MFLSYLAIISTSALISCGNPVKESNSNMNTIDWEQITKVEYRYEDSSVPPDYHRSYTIVVTDSSKSIIIDSYGTVLLTQQYANSPKSFKTFIEHLSYVGISKHKEKEDNGCCGGTTEYIRLYKGDDKLFDAYVYHCSGDFGDLSMPDGTADWFKEQIPEDVSSMIESTLNTK